MIACDRENRPWMAVMWSGVFPSWLWGQTRTQCCHYQLNMHVKQLCLLSTMFLTDIRQGGISNIFLLVAGKKCYMFVRCNYLCYVPVFVIFFPADLNVDVGPVAHQQLQAEGAMSRWGREVKRCKAFVVHPVDLGATFDELIHHHVLAVVAGHVERRVAISVGLIDLDGRDGRETWIHRKVWKHTTKTKRSATGSVISYLSSNSAGSLSCVGGTHIHPQVQEVLDDADHSTGGGCMQGGVKLLIFAGHLGPVRRQQLHHFYVT